VDVQKQQDTTTSVGTNGHGNGTDPGSLRFNEIAAELEHSPVIVPEWIAQRPAWLRVPLQKVRSLILMVQKKPGTFTIRDGIIYAILGTSLTFGVTNYWKRQDEHDEVIRLRTIVEIQEKNNSERDLRIETARNFATIADKNVTRLEGKVDQFMQIYSIKNASKANLTFDRE